MLQNREHIENKERFMDINYEDKSIVDFKVDDNIESFFLLKDFWIKDKANGKKYLDLTLADKDKEINAKYWDLKDDEHDIFVNGTIIKVRGKVIEWQNKPQLRINKIRNIVDEDEVEVSDFVQKAPFDSEEMYELLISYINRIGDSEIQKLCREIIVERKKTLIYFPAAQKNHHSLYGGLLYHTTTMLKSGDLLADIYDFLNKDLLFAGIILHDIAKIDEMNSNNLGVVSEYTVEGQLLGHIIQGIKLINQKGTELDIDKEKLLLLEHMVLSHHNEPEYGSPKRPMIPEAELLCHLDFVDARMFDMRKALMGVEEGEFSDKVWLLNNRKLYKYKENGSV